jgi:tetratricopeptide (TPR) repeat protein
VPAWALLGLLGIGGLATGCSRAEPPGAESAADGLVPVPEPDLSALDADFRQRIEQQQAALGSDGGASGPAYGRLGVSYLAAEFEDAATACFRNARLLDPEEFRWPYFLGHLYRERAELEPAVEAFERALELRPDEVAALSWLAGTLQELGQPAEAERRFRRLLELKPGSAFARLGLGKLALAAGDSATAVEHLEEALRLQPEATIVHYPLGQAYRGLGDLERARQHLEQRGDVDILPADPWMDEVRGLIGGPMLWADRGAEAYVAGNWDVAVRAFTRAVDGAPEVARMRVNLAAALFRTGDAEAAKRTYEEALALDPASSRALYGLGALLENAGDDHGAIERYRAALAAEAGYPPAHLRLGETLRRLGRHEEALPHYAAVLEVDPRQAAARLGRVMSLVRLGRWADARDDLAEAIAVLPDQPAFAHALARVLVSAPDDSVRDAARAMQLLGPLARNDRSTDLAETIAMAMAESGRFDEAIEWQRRAIDVAREAGHESAAATMRSNLARYERGEACRLPWPEGHPLHRPARTALPALPSRDRTS